jgi:hypothetical protein
MKTKLIMMTVGILLVTSISSFASEPKLDGAYRLVGISFQGGGSTEADVKGILVVHGKYMAFVRAQVNREKWEQSEPESERTKKIVAAYQGLAATAGSFEIQGNTITLTQIAQASPASMGTSTKWDFKKEGKKLLLTPTANPGVVFAFEMLP